MRLARGDEVAGVTSGKSYCGPHHVDGRGHARPELERRRSLRDEHVEPADDVARPPPGRRSRSRCRDTGARRASGRDSSRKSTSSRSLVAWTTSSAPLDVRRPVGAAREDPRVRKRLPERHRRPAVADDYRPLAWATPRGWPRQSWSPARGRPRPRACSPTERLSRRARRPRACAARSRSPRRTRAQRGHAEPPRAAPGERRARRMRGRARASRTPRSASAARASAPPGVRAGQRAASAPRSRRAAQPQP